MERPRPREVALGVQQVGEALKARRGVWVLGAFGAGARARLSVTGASVRVTAGDVSLFQYCSSVSEQDCTLSPAIHESRHR